VGLNWGAGRVGLDRDAWAADLASEPAQAPDFDEFTIVITGSIDVEHDGRTTNVGAGQALITRAGEKVRYLTREDAHYVAICVPAFAPELANRDDEE
jgi:mannose-6-phosphate isomerase-like protein (cupin superfamily)